MLSLGVWGNFSLGMLVKNRGKVYYFSTINYYCNKIVIVIFELKKLI